MVFNRTISSITKTLVPVALMFFVFGCATYHDRITDYYQRMIREDYAGAESALDKNKLLQKSRNLLLFYMEKGRVEHLKGNYTLSNQYLNKADLLIEDQVAKFGDVMVGLFLNSMSQSYKGEEFEIFMLHYYKALNYLYLGQSQEALVEARRISLQNYEQGDKYSNKTTRYSKDAFSLNLQGLIYESTGNYNDAFIAYRNAVEVYQSAVGGLYYGVSIPENLKYDVMNMAYKLGFTNDLRKFEKDFGKTFKPFQAAEGGELVVFWENGTAPIKEEENIMFSLIKGDSGALVFTNALGVMIPLDFGIAGHTDLSDVHSVNIAYPKYISTPVPFAKAQVQVNGTATYVLEKVQDIDVVAVSTLQERAGKELGKILTRLAVKKSAEYAVKSVARSNDNNAVLEGVGLGLQLYNLFSEKADTRNWQTLPAEIKYARVPLAKGKNQLAFDLQRPNGPSVKQEVEIESNGGLKFYNFATMR
ncbi:COG3014 family protein [Myroides sp. C15-4]|uniref:COG3014 family protein n=1 Tax=Myroides sp. C15-4 TaxID=3400532 RepID=UPI003D2F58FE